MAYKIQFKGARGVGKSCLLTRYTKNQFNLDTTTTIGIEFSQKNIYLTKFNQSVSLQIWDTAGQERFKAITTSYYRNAIGALIIFDLTERETFENLKSWIDDLKQFGEDQMVKMIIGNKVDLENKRQVNKEEAINFAKQNNTAYLETSSKTGENVNTSFEKLAEEIVTMLQEEDKTTVSGSFYQQGMNSDIYSKNSRKDNINQFSNAKIPVQNEQQSQSSHTLSTQQTKPKKKSGSCC